MTSTRCAAVLNSRVSLNDRRIQGTQLLFSNAYSHVDLDGPITVPCPSPNSASSSFVSTCTCARRDAGMLQVTDTAVELRFKERLMFNLPILQPKVAPRRAPTSLHCTSSASYLIPTRQPPHARRPQLHRALVQPSPRPVAHRPCRSARRISQVAHRLLQPAHPRAHLSTRTLNARARALGHAAQVPLSGKLTLKRGGDGLIVSYREALGPVLGRVESVEDGLAAFCTLGRMRSVYPGLQSSTLYVLSLLHRVQHTLYCAVTEC